MNDIIFYVVLGSAVLTAMALYRISNTEQLINFIINRKEVNKATDIKRRVRVVFPDRAGVYNVKQIMIIGKDEHTGEYKYGIITYENPNEVMRYVESQLKIKTPLYDLAMDGDIAVQVVSENFEKKVNDKIAASMVELQAERDAREKYAGYLMKVIAERNKIEKELRKGRYDYGLGFSPYTQKLFSDGGLHSPPIEGELLEEGGEG